MNDRYVLADGRSKRKVYEDMWLGLLREQKIAKTEIENRHSKTGENRKLESNRSFIHIYTFLLAIRCLRQTHTQVPQSSGDALPISEDFEHFSEWQQKENRQADPSFLTQIGIHV